MKGHIHPLSAMVSQATKIFAELGFEVAHGPEIETEHFNFDALNIPKDHPARDMWDTFWTTSKEGGERLLLRTHTSPVQIRYMQANKPPIKIVAPGKVFRHEATDATHEAQFYQLECLRVDKEVSMADLKATIEYFFKKLFGEETKVRFRPSFFPFVEPGLEVDIFFNNKWLEVGGAGMVHPNVLKGVGLGPYEYQGFAFGMGIDRLVMIKHGITDVRLLHNGDARLVAQFNS